MIPNKIIVKQISDFNADLVGLSKYGKSKMPGTFDWLQASLGPDNRYITGLDEDSIFVNSIEDEIEREAKKEEIKNLREKLARSIGKDLSATSDYWETFGVEIKSDDDLVLVNTNPMHQVMYHMLISNYYVAPSREDTGKPEYKNSKYYAHSESRATTQNVTLKKLRDKATVKLVELSEKGKDHMILVGQFLDGKKFHEKLKEDDLYEMLSFYPRSTDDEDVKRFLQAVEKPVEELIFKSVIDKAVRNKIIKYSGGYYQRGQVTLGKNINEVYNNLQLPEFAAEFLSIQKELNK
jgi:hypothetical protein